MPKFDTQGNSYLVAIVFYNDKEPKKYRHNIKDTTHYRRMFKGFASKDAGALYINYYHKASNTYSDREYIKNFDHKKKQWI